jgi:hypothetical protein
VVGGQWRSTPDHGTTGQLDYEAGRQRTEDGGPRAEVRSQRSEIKVPALNRIRSAARLLGPVR